MPKHDWAYYASDLFSALCVVAGCWLCMFLFYKIYLRHFLCQLGLSFRRLVWFTVIVFLCNTVSGALALAINHWNRPVGKVLDWLFGV